MAPARITQLFSSWTDLTSEVEVVTLTATVQKWTLSKVKERFEEEGRNNTFVCPRLPSSGFPSMAARFNTARDNKEELRRLIREDEHFILAQHVLGTKNATLPNQYTRFETYILADHGRVIVHARAHTLTDDQCRLVEEDPKEFLKGIDTMEISPNQTEVDTGDFIKLPAHLLYSLFFKEDSLLTMGNIFPHKEPVA